MSPSNFTGQTLAWFDEGDHPEPIMSDRSRGQRFARALMMFLLAAGVFGLVIILW